MKKTLALVALAAVLAPTAFAAEPPPLPKDFPGYGADRPLPVPAIAKSTLPNGLTVWIVKRPAFPKVSIVLAVRGGTVA
ncbi:MAG TPA: insulinase family protein, partial [Thermoanaerobaculia bacterium]|nr:insulinase family protein [Thermoanaerobaculia bacterium]